MAKNTKKTSSNLLFVVRKKIWAKSASQAINLDKKTPVEEVFLDPDFEKERASGLGKKCAGFDLT